MLSRGPVRSMGHCPTLGAPGLAVPEEREDGPSDRPQVPIAGGAAFAVHPGMVGNRGGPNQDTQYPYVTGGSVVAVKYKDGVLMASDTLGSYGHTKRYKDVERVKKVNDSCVIGAGGEISDFMYITRLLNDFGMEDYCADDGMELGPAQVHSILCRVMYNRRSKFDPLWNSVVVAGVEDGQPFLGMVGMIGTNYVDDHVATGFGNYLSRPMLREHYRPGMTEAEATELLNSTLRVLFYRDSMAINKFRMAKVTKEGVTISDPYAVDVNWDLDGFVNPSKIAHGFW